LITDIISRGSLIDRRRRIDHPHAPHLRNRHGPPARLDLPGIPQHIVQHGNDRQACFADATDYLRYRRALGEAALRYDCALHTYGLMTNHVHLLATPHEPGGVSRMMQAMMMKAIARRHVGEVDRDSHNFISQSIGAIHFRSHRRRNDAQHV
jgi:REP element-mobilizing transposase RayT